MNTKKCEFLKHEFIFLGHIVGDTGVNADPGKVEVITDMPRPTTVSQLRSFLSSISFFTAIHPNYGISSGTITQAQQERTRSERGTQKLKLLFEKQNLSFVIHPVLHFIEPKPSID